MPDLYVHLDVGYTDLVICRKGQSFGKENEV